MYTHRSAINVTADTCMSFKQDSNLIFYFLPLLDSNISCKVSTLLPLHNCMVCSSTQL